MGERIEVRVECYAGHRAAQEPRAVHLDDGRHLVAGIADRWYDPDGDTFRVRTTSGLRLLLQYDRREDCWWLLQREALDA